MLEPRIVATAGHIDHGKSTLVEALTGINPDRLPEEQKRGMTIELGFAHLDLPDRQTAGTGWHIGIVDVPGHADFVRNMVAGVGSIDAALLVVAADDGWMPQTEEHFQILLHLGVEHGLVALTKRDLAGSLEDAAAEIRARLAKTPWAKAPIVPVCALSGEGLDELKLALSDVLRATLPPADRGKPRLFVDRVFSPRGAGTVVTGTLTGGVLRTGDSVIVQPAGLRGKIRGLQNHNRSVESARPGMRTAIQISGVDAARDASSGGVRRGDVIEAGPLLSPGASHVIHVWLERPPIEDGSAKTPQVKHGQRVWFHHGTAGTEARLYLVDTRQLTPGAGGIGELRFKQPVAVHAGDRFVLRDYSRRHTLGGGRVLERSAQPRAWKKPAVRESLLARAEQPDEAAAWVTSLLLRDGTLRTEGLLLRSAFDPVEVEAALNSVDGIRFPGWILTGESWIAALEIATGAVQSYHRENPMEPGMSLADWRAAVAACLPDEALAGALLDELCARGFVKTQSLIRDGAFKPALPSAVRRACLALRGVLFTDKVNPPGISVYVRTPDEKAALRSMLQSGELFMLDDDTAMLTAGYEDLKVRILATLRDAGRATIAALRDATGSTRRILVPVCERMDRERLTVRDGDYRRAAISSASHR